MKNLVFIFLLFSSNVDSQINNCQLLITGQDSEHLVSIDGIILENNNDLVFKYHEIYNEKIYYLQNFEDSKILLYDIATATVDSIVINTTNIEFYGNFKIIDNTRIALLDNKNDKVYFIDFEGNLLNTSLLLNPSNNWQNLTADILNNELILSENGNRELIAIDLNTYDSRIFKDLTSLSSILGRIKIVENIIYLSTRSEIYKISENSEPEQIINLDGEYNITGLDVLNNFIFFQTNFGQKVYYADTISYNPVLITSELINSQLRQLSVLDRDCFTVNSNSEVSTFNFKIFPNPANDQLNIEVEIDDEFEMSLYSIDGVFINKYRNPKCIELSSLTKGLYVLRFKEVGEIVFKDEIIIVE